MADLCSLVTVETALGGVVGLAGAARIGLGIVAIIGDIYARRRKVRGLALARAILAIPCAPPLGILATVFVSMGKSD